jgi:hypothetical protein
MQTMGTSCIYLQILEGRTSKGLELYFHTLLGGVKKHPMMGHEVKFVATSLDLGIIIQNIHKAQELQKKNWQTIKSAQ